MNRIIRVFPRKTSMTPDDENVRINRGPDLFDELDDHDEVHISVTFTQDIPRGEKLAALWEKRFPNTLVLIGGPATGERGGEFVPGMYLKHGNVITSRGCPNRCWFCSVWKREGPEIRELPICEGWNVLDDNLLQCSEWHIKDVFQMLSKQKKRPVFSGGLEAAALKDWHIEELLMLNPQQMFFAYDTPDDYEPLVDAGKRLQEADFTRHQLRCYCLIGYPGDTLSKAENRLWQCVRAGFYPQAMKFRYDPFRLQDVDDPTSRQWMRALIDEQKEFAKMQREWSRPAIIYSKIKNGGMQHG